MWRDLGDLCKGSLTNLLVRCLSFNKVKTVSASAFLFENIWGFAKERNEYKGPFKCLTKLNSSIFT